jgi:calcineurin-like phosphoesterase family protein
MNELFFTSDTHFGHYNIMRYCERPFDTTEEQDETLIQNWNSVVKPNDSIYHLGDFGFGPQKETFDRLNGIKHLIIGNHDKKPILHMGWESVRQVFMLKYYDYRIWLSHYPHRSWPNAFHGSWHLFGHNHGRLSPQGKSFDCGVDCTNFIPMSLPQVEDKMRKLKGLIEELM